MADPWAQDIHRVIKEIATRQTVAPIVTQYLCDKCHEGENGVL